MQIEINLMMATIFQVVTNTCSCDSFAGHFYLFFYVQSIHSIVFGDFSMFNLLEIGAHTSIDEQID